MADVEHVVSDNLTVAIEEPTPAVTRRDFWEASIHPADPTAWQARPSSVILRPRGVW